MATVDLDRNRWHDYFDEMAHAGRANEAHVEASGLDIGDQVEMDWLPLTGITYDPKSDVLEVTTDKVDHLINHPSAISIDYDSEGLRNIAVTDAEGHHQVIRLREPLRLPAP